MKLVAFDYDGTLSDSLGRVIDAMAALFEARGLVPPTADEFFRGLDRDYLAFYRTRGLDVTREEVVHFTNEHFMRNPKPTVFFPHARETLESLHASGHILALVSLNEARFVEPHLKERGLTRFLHHREFRSLHKDEALARICKEHGIHPDEACFVGDTPSDMRHAHRAGVIAVAFLNGIVPEDLFTGDAAPDFWVRSHRELFYLLRDWI